MSDQDLLRSLDGELSPGEAKRVEAHLADCGACRARRQEIETSLGEFVLLHEQLADFRIRPADGPRAVLKARLSQLTETPKTAWQRGLRHFSWRAGWAALAAAMIAIAILSFQRLSHRDAPFLAVTVPNPSLTPGATVLLSREQVCRATSINNKVVPAALQRRVFEEYGIRQAEPRAYEIDYLVTPALGGADDIHNLWPESNRATLWNAEVKDMLEDYLRNRVCAGEMDLATAQHEIATDWIRAYKKYFHTDRPLTAYR